jgi:hypothetical protein
MGHCGNLLRTALVIFFSWLADAGMGLPSRNRSGTSSRMS